MWKNKTNYKKIGLLAFFATWMIICFLLYKPLPEGFTKTRWDRITMHIVEPALRVTYYYPSRMFAKASNMVWWTRAALENLSKILGPIFYGNPSIDVFDRTWNGVPVRVYMPEYNQSNTHGAVIFIHGGGFALGSVNMYDSFVRRMTQLSGKLYVSVEYRLSPETPFPGGILDCEAAVDYLFERGPMEFGIDASKIVIMGDSAGGNLATVLTQRRVSRNAKTPFAGQVLIYPLLQFADLQTMSYRYFNKRLNGYALVDPESVAYYYMFYAGIDMDEKGYLIKRVLSNGHVSDRTREQINNMLPYRKYIEEELNYDNFSVPARPSVEESKEAQDLLEPFLMNPDFSPLMKDDLSGLPSTLVLTCEFDILRDEGILYAKRLEAAGVDTILTNYKNGFHGMLNFHNELSEASAMMFDILEWTLKVVN